MNERLSPEQIAEGLRLAEKAKDTLIGKPIFDYADWYTRNGERALRQLQDAERAVDRLIEQSGIDWLCPPGCRWHEGGCKQRESPHADEEACKAHWREWAMTEDTATLDTTEGSAK